jgi:prolyl-tRNA editing enzyme YbaK/EbsC (Cys-tRNA(Pro) deacylase)
VFRGAQSGGAILVIACGDNRVSEAKVAAIVGEALGRADPEFVRAATGYPIGGVAPVGHALALTLLLDTDLRRFNRVWAAGGTPHSVFAIAPDDLQRATKAGWSDIRV